MTDEDPALVPCDDEPDEDDMPQDSEPTDPLRSALQPFANMAEAYRDQPDDYGVLCDSARNVRVTAGDFRRALRALEGK
jgi:hypothetical protein